MPVAVQRANDVAAAVQEQDRLATIGVRRRGPFRLHTIRGDRFHLTSDGSLYCRPRASIVAAALGDVVGAYPLGDDFAQGNDFRIAHRVVSCVSCLPSTSFLRSFRHGKLKEASVVEHRGVFLVPADIAAAVARPRFVDGAAAVLAKELAGGEARLDALAAFAGALDDMPFLELAHGQAEELRQPPDVVAADLDVAGGPATERRALQAIKRTRWSCRQFDHGRGGGQGRTDVSGRQPLPRHFVTSDRQTSADFAAQGSAG